MRLYPLLFVFVLFFLSIERVEADAKIINVGYGFYNIYLIEDEGGLLLIDAGLPDKIQKLEGNIRKEGYNPEAVRFMIITHAHTDHVGAAAWFQEKYGTKIILHKEDIDVAVSGRIDSLKIVNSNRLFGKLAYSQVKWDFPAFSPDIIVNDSLDLKEYGFNIKIETVGGHTPGSIIIIQDKNLFTGDLIRGGLISRKKPRVHFFAQDYQLVEQTLNDLVNRNFKMWYPGHGGPLEATDVIRFLNKNQIF